MDIKEIQSYIDNQEWDKLSNVDYIVDILGDYAFSPNTITPTKELFTEFFYNITYMKKILDVNNLYWFGLAYSINQMALDLNFNQNDWALYADTFIMYLNKKIMSEPRQIPSIFRWEHKNVAFLEFLMDGNNFAKYEKLLNPYYGMDVPFVTFDAYTLNLFEKASPDVQEKFKETFKDIIKFNKAFSAKAEIVANIFGDDIDSLKIIIDNVNYSQSTGAVLSKVSKTDFMKYLSTIIDTDQYVSTEEIRNVCNWFSYNKNEEIDDDVLVNLHKHNFFQEIYHNPVVEVMNKEQLKKYANEITTKTLAKSKLSLSEVIDLKNIASTDLFDISVVGKFYTNEEIAKHPNLFDPKTIKQTQHLYMSPETLKLLNKTWGTRQRYDIRKYANFENIFASAIQRLELFNFDDAKYLQTQLNVSNSEMLNVLCSFQSPVYLTNPIFENIQILKEFGAKFK